LIYNKLPNYINILLIF